MHAPPRVARALPLWLPALLAALVLLAACSVGDARPAPAATTSPPPGGSASSAPSGALPTGTPTTTTSATTTAGADAGADASTPSPAVSEPVLVGADGQVLPQTDERPSSDSPLLQHHARLLFQAIVADEPAIAEPVFFPRLAYEQVKDIEKPGADWKSRLMKAFTRDIHDYHRKLGAEPARCELLRLEIPDDKAQWMKRGSEGNKLPYWRVKRSKLHYRDADGKERALELTSCISWRGQWYVVHLHGFK